MKKIIASLIVAVALAGCTSTESVVSPEKSAIDRVFAADSTYASSSTSIAQLVIKQKTLSLVGCPADFVSAYKDKISAWEKMEAIEVKMYAANQAQAAADINSFLNTYSTNPVKAIIDLKSKWPQFSDELDSAFTAIEKSKTNLINIGIRYSAAYPMKTSVF